VVLRHLATRLVAGETDLLSTAGIWTDFGFYTSLLPLRLLNDGGCIVVGVFCSVSGRREIVDVKVFSILSPDLSSV